MALTVTRRKDPVSLGRSQIRTFRVTLSAATQDDEYIVTGLSTIDAVLGYATLGATGGSLSFVLNGQGGGATEGDDPGDLGVETSQAADYEITVVGR